MNRILLILLLVLLFRGSPPAQGAEDRPYVFVVSAVISPVITLELYSDFLEYMKNQLGRPVVLKQRRTYREILELLKEGQAQFGHLCTGPFVYGWQNFGIQPVAIPVIRGRAFYRCYVVVKKSSPYQRLEDLRGRSFVLTDPLSLTSAYILWRLAQMGTSAEKFFRRTFYSYAHDKSLELVAAGIADGASVGSLVYESLDPETHSYLKDLRVLEVSPPFGNPPVVASPEVPPEFLEKVQEILLRMHKDPEGRRILKKMHVDRFIPPDPAFYHSVRVLLPWFP